MSVKSYLLEEVTLQLRLEGCAGITRANRKVKRVVDKGVMYMENKR